MIRTRCIELAVGRAFAKAYPWLAKVQRPSGAGLFDSSALLMYPAASNDVSFRVDACGRIEVAESKEPDPARRSTSAATADGGGDIAT